MVCDADSLRGTAKLHVQAKQYEELIHFFPIGTGSFTKMEAQKNYLTLMLVSLQGDLSGI